MLEQKVKILSESLARNMDRRKFLKQTGSTVFAGMAALAAGHLMGGSASAAERKPLEQMRPQCAPPGPFCNLNGDGNDPNGCHGSSCYQHLYNGQVMQCRVFYIYQAGCWTTYVSGGYWVCCDCECFDSSGGNRRTCGCAHFSTQPLPRPDGPGGGTDA